jgi:hypothetical protein
MERSIRHHRLLAVVAGTCADEQRSCAACGGVQRRPAIWPCGVSSSMILGM